EVEGRGRRRAGRRFAMAGPPVVDLAQALGRPPLDDIDRLAADELVRLRASLTAAGVSLHVGAGADEKLAELRRMYEPYVAALSRLLIMPLPPWRAGAASHENWRTTAWGNRGPGLRGGIDPHEND